MCAGGRDPGRGDGERPDPDESLDPDAIDPPPFAGAPMRYYEVDVGILAHWPYGRGPEFLTETSWVPFLELTKFAYEAMPITAEHFAILRAKLFPALADDPCGGE